MARQKPGEPIPTARDVRVSGNIDRKSITLLFDTPATPTGVEVPFALLPSLLGQIAQALIHAPESDARELAKLFAIREVAAQLHGNVPTLRYELEAGLMFQHSFELARARRLADELRTMIEHLDSLGSSGKIH